MQTGYNKVSIEFITKLKEIVGHESVFTDLTDVYPYALDGTLFNVNTIPEAVVQPSTVEQISLILKLCNEFKIPATPRGSGTSLAGNSLAIYGGIVIDMIKFDKITEINIPDNIVIVEPGVICDKLNEALAKEGYFFPPDPGSSSAATIGGMVANNSGGLQAFKYGVTANYVVWLEVVLPNGEIMEFGSKTLKSVSSLNIGGLLIGSEGTLGIITQIGLKIRPLPVARKTGFFIYEEFETITEIIITIRKARIIPNMQEFLDKTAEQVCFQYLGGDYLSYPIGYFLLLEVDGTKNQVEEEFDIIQNICIQAKPLFYKIAQNPKDRDMIIQARKVALPALSRLAPTTSLEDFTVNITQLSVALHKIEELAQKIQGSGVRLATFGHLEGNLHPTFMFNEHNSDDITTFERAIDIIYSEIVIPLGGTVTGEHGVGFVKAKYMEREHKSSVNLMHKIKLLFDPNLILNPGKAKGSKRFDYQNPVPIKQKDLINVPAMSCMRCGFCLSECPSYKNFQKESFSPRGKLSLIRGALRGNILIDSKFREALYSCTLCGYCQSKCPASIKTIDIFEGTRKLIGDNQKKN